ncbi:hypothetical protein HDU76_012409, partial [Blyttiomyces sp. JEL0837]
GSVVDSTTTIRITNLHPMATEADVKTCFQEFGSVQKCILHMDASHKSTGIADVTYDNKKSAQDAIAKYHNKEADGLVLKVVEVPKGGIAEDLADQREHNFFERFVGKTKVQGAKGESQSQSAEEQKNEQPYYNYEFLLEYYAGIYVTASLDKDSRLSGANSFESSQNTTGWSIAVGGWVGQGQSSSPEKVKTRRHFV